MTFTFPAAQVDPELNAGSSAPAFVLHQVDVAYKFTPLIPGRVFNVLLLTFPNCNANGVCVLHRQSVMRGRTPEASVPRNEHFVSTKPRR